MLPYANLLANLRATCKTAVLNNSFSNSFFGFPQKTKKKKKKETPRINISAKKSVFGYRVRLQIRNPDFKI